MNERSFTTTFSVEQSPKEVFDAVGNVRGWWSEEIQGNTNDLGDEFAYRRTDLHRCRMRLTEVVPGKKVVWRVLDNYFSFTTDQAEWKDTEIHFEITRIGDETQLQFTHVGLVSEHQCFDVCSKAWSFYINSSLRDLITTGKGAPNPRETERSDTAA
ncbi:MAG: SRPBCC domain-containing protein [Polyangiaceae bacterium]|nr:SRPBCC domain-containing protein [Polyangiaceae bacterium]